MTIDEAPIGTVVKFGNPQEPHFARKMSEFSWALLEFTEYLNLADITLYDDLHKTATVVHIPIN